jgi:hypothetical protein
LQKEKVMRKSHASESFSHFVVALAGAAVILGAVTWAFVAMDNHGCAQGVTCRPAGVSQPHY